MLPGYSTHRYINDLNYASRSLIAEGGFAQYQSKKQDDEQSDRGWERDRTQANKAIDSPAHQKYT